MDYIDCWDVSYNYDSSRIVEEFQKYVVVDNDNNHGITYLFLLDQLNKNASLIENFIFQIADFHIKRLNIKNPFIEFWFKGKTGKFTYHLDCDEHIKETTGDYIHPFISCLTYLNDHNCSTILTEVDNEKYLYKNFHNEKRLCMSFPSKNKQITFNPKLYHGTTNIFDDNYDNRYILAINIWSGFPPKNIEYFKSSKYSNINSKFDSISLKINKSSTDMNKISLNCVKIFSFLL